MDLGAAEARVGPGEVDVLEDARGATSFRNRLSAVDSLLVEPEHLTRADVAVDGGADQVERARLGGNHPVVSDPAEREGTDPVRVAERDERAVDEGHDRVGALEAPHRGGDRLG